jgi:hypothetical protein
VDGVVYEFGDAPGPHPHFREAQLKAQTASNHTLSASP